MGRHPGTGFIAILAILLFTIPRSFAKSVAYCSSENTSDEAAKVWAWQSNGWCNDACKDSHPFGVILGQDCWCSDYIPSDQVDTSECSSTCPGFPSEFCGNDQKNLYIYIRLDSNAEVLGTKGTSQPTSSSSQSTFKTTTAAPSDTAAPVPTDTVPVTSVHLVTVSGVIVTQTVITTPSAVPAQTSQQKQKTPVGAIVGGVIGGFTVLGAIVGSVIFALWRRRRQQQQDDDEDRSGVHRNTSTMSKAGLIRGEMGPQYPPKIATTFNSRNSRVLDNDSISPISGSDRRSSRLVFDQRLNPSAIMVLDNPSRESFVSMDDSRDYGRTLNVRNPDPDTR